LTKQQMVILLVNIVAWPLIHMGFAWGGTQLKWTRFKPQHWLFRQRACEREGRLYISWFRIKAWKDRLPDAGAWFGGFPKKRLEGTDPAYLRRFVAETCRGELVHWASMLAAGVFFFWNPLWAGWVMVGYGVLANLPCIFIQRYNRIRISRMLKFREPAEVSR